MRPWQLFSRPRGLASDQRRIALWHSEEEEGSRARSNLHSVAYDYIESRKYRSYVTVSLYQLHYCSRASKSVQGPESLYWAQTSMHKIRAEDGKAMAASFMHTQRHSSPCPAYRPHAASPAFSAPLRWDRVSKAKPYVTRVIVRVTTHAGSSFRSGR